MATKKSGVPKGKLDLLAKGLKRSAVTTVDEFLQTGDSNTYLEKFPCVCEDDMGVFAIRDGALYRCGEFDPVDFCFCDDWKRRTVPDGVVVKPWSKGAKAPKFQLVLNGDEVDVDEAPVEMKNKSLVVTVSFEVFSQLLRPPKGKPLSVKKVVQGLHAGEIRILDAHPDEIKKLNPTDRRKVSALAEKTVAKTRHLEHKEVSGVLRPPESGFTLLSGGANGAPKDKYHWHRAATILFQHAKKTYLIGQDEGTYFGCLLADHPETIGEAYRSLMPASIRRFANLDRQGEWFVVPVPDKDVPGLANSITFNQEDDGSIILPRPDSESKTHQITAVQGRISADGLIFVRGGELYHDDHITVSTPANKWSTFVRNTAVRSVSVEGVD